MAAKAFPERLALTADGVTSTYAELAADAGAIASSLARYGVGPDTRVALWAPNSRDWIAAYYGAAMTGAVVVPINAMSTAEEVIYILQDSGATVLITGTDSRKGLASVRDAVSLKHVVLTADAAPANEMVPLASLIESGDANFMPAPVDRNALSTIGYTSNSTGRRIYAAEAQTLGRFNEVVSDGDLMESAKELAYAIASGPPLAIRFMNENINRAMLGYLMSCLAMEADRLVRRARTEDHNKAVAAFLEKRNRNFAPSDSRAAWSSRCNKTWSAAVKGFG